MQNSGGETKCIMVYVKMVNDKIKTRYFATLQHRNYLITNSHDHFCR